MAASSGGFSITIGVVDQATKKLDAVNKRLAAFTAPMRRYAAVQKKFAESSGMTKIARGMRTIGTEAITATQRLSRVIAPLRVITSAASVGGMYALVSSWANFAMRLNIAAQRADVTRNQLLGLQGAARLAGASAEGLTAGMVSLRDAVTNAVGGRDINALRMLNTLFQHGEWRAWTHDMPTMLKNVADKIRLIRDPAKQATVAMALLGSAGSDLLPLMRRGSAGIAELVAETLRYNSVTDAQEAAAQRLYTAQTKLELAVQGLGTTIAADLAPAFAPVLTYMADWIRRNREWIGQALDEKVRAFARYLQSVNWRAVGHVIDRIGGGIATVVNLLGGWQNTAIALLAFWGTAFVAGMVAPIVTIGVALSGLIAKIATARGEMGGLSAAGIGLGGGRAGFGPSRGLALAGAGGMAYRIIEDWINGTGPTMTEAESRRLGLGESPRFRNPFVGSPRVTPTGTHTPASGMRPEDFLPPPGTPRGIANNNPLNLSYVPGQIGLDPNHPSDGRFGRYTSMDAGVASAERQLLRYQASGLTTVRQMVSKWAPPSENDTGSYVKQVAGAMGVSPDAPIDLHDRRLSALMIEAMARRETGRPLDPKVANRGVGEALGKTQIDRTPAAVAAASPIARAPVQNVWAAGGSAPPATVRLPPIATGQPVNVGNGAAGPAAAAAGPQGAVHVTFGSDGLPPGVTVTKAKATGNATTSAPRVETGLQIGAFP